ncbi:hypothetical protein PMIN06_001719 [Paraphaeosphaeria minitans]|uniref:Uncharacterized protein n=1 Tax=Paraphaeosphaeria minitans TaxID=565426 RepID=A0A9P6GNJ6_9PLEO|nr:hypothetical protein PMIN01_03839 [Paraphaeosphaeria minitans]
MTSCSAPALPPASPPPPPPPPGPPPATPPPPPPYPPRPPPLSRQQEREGLLRHANTLCEDWMDGFDALPPPERIYLDRILDLCRNP